MIIKEAFQLFDLDPVKYFKSCDSQVEANNVLNFIKEIVKKTYKKLALKYHPDSNSGGGNPELFARYTEAKNVLLDLKIEPISKSPVSDLEMVFEGFPEPTSSSWRRWDMEEDIKTYAGTYHWTHTGSGL